MKISHNWLRQYVAHDLAPETLAEMLTMSGLEVEDVEPLGPALEGVVVGHVLETTAHPKADRLTLCRVDLGAGDPVQIVCGAPNVAAGQKVPVATVGTTLLLPGRDDPTQRQPVTLKKAKLRGETSEGMICAEDELGLSEDHSGIMVLHDEAPPGQPFADYLRAQGLDAQDAVLDVSITPNRPDATCHIGIARDVAALTDLALELPSVDLPEPGGPVAEHLTVEIEAPAACPRYAALRVRGVRVGESPAWLKQRLTAVGLRPRNNVVDVTNYVMYECGQPLHAFDYEQLAGQRIVIRQAEAEEPFTTLDGKARTLPQGTLLICDAERPVAIAGLMGGENSEVSGATTDVLIESAHFDPTTIRRAAKALGLQTDASYRFERGVDADGQVWAAARAARLIAELAGGEVVGGVVDAHPRPTAPRQIPLRLSRLEHVLGVAVPVEEARRLLTAIGFALTEEYPLDVIAEHVMEGRPLDVVEEERTLQCTVPSFRPDVEREIDVIEEVARLYGFDRIPEPARTTLPQAVPREQPLLTLRRRTRSLLVGLGCQELYTNSMLRTETAARFNEDVLGGLYPGEVVETLNPISQEMAALRPSLLPGVLQVIGFNQNHGQRVLRFFEFGHVFRRSPHGSAYVAGYAEHESLLLALSGPQTRSGWDVPERAVDFFDLKGLVETLFDALHLAGVALQPDHTETPVTAYHATMTAAGERLGVLARLSDALADDFDLKAPVYFAEFDFERLAALAAPQLRPQFTPVNRFPVVERDLAVVVDRSQPAGPLLETIRATGQPLLQHVTVFDLYEGKGIPPEQKSLAFALRFGADRTLKDEEVEARIEAIVAALKQRHEATLRG